MSVTQAVWTELDAVVGGAIDDIELTALVDRIVFHRLTAGADDGDVYTMVDGVAVYGDGSFVRRDEAA